MKCFSFLTITLTIVTTLFSNVDSANGIKYRSMSDAGDAYEAHNTHNTPFFTKSLNLEELDIQNPSVTAFLKNGGVHMCLEMKNATNVVSNVIDKAYQIVDVDYDMVPDLTLIMPFKIPRIRLNEQWFISQKMDEITIKITHTKMGINIYIKKENNVMTFQGMWIKKHFIVPSSTLNLILDQMMDMYVAVSLKQQQIYSEPKFLRKMRT